MISNELEGKMLRAAKWAILSEIASKAISPIASMVLARLLTPDAFGAVATAAMVVSFAEMFADAGFQKYLVQHEFENREEKLRYTNVAFWTNLGISFLLWGIIALFSRSIAVLTGNPDLRKAIVVACIQLPLTAFSSIQEALCRRGMDFRKLFTVRTVSLCIPFFVTIPLAVLGFGYWSIILGNLWGHFSKAFILTAVSDWKPALFYSKAVLKDMVSFSIWSLVEAVSIWLTSWIDAFIIGNALSSYYLGLYKTSLNMVNAIMAMVTSATAPVLFSALSRLQDNSGQFSHILLKTQRTASILVFPLGVGIYLYSGFAAQVLLGERWMEAGGVMGHWALTSALMIVFGHYFSEAYRARGLPKLSFLAQVLHLAALVPACIISSRHGFWPLVYTRSWIRIQFVLVHFIIVKNAIGISIAEIAKNVLPAFASSIIMGFAGYFLKKLSNGAVWNAASILICIIIYFRLIYRSPDIRQDIDGYVRHVKDVNKLVRSRQAQV